MIRLHNVTKRYRTTSGWNTVIDDVSVTFPKGVNLGILGRNGAGKSTLLRLLARGEYPTSGHITYDVSLSWPIAFSGTFAPALTGVDNVRFVARIYGTDWRRMLAFVEDFSELGEYLYMPLKSYSSGMRARFAFALSMSIEFDCYLIDEVTAVGDKRFTDRCQMALSERRERSSIILVSHNPRNIRNQCDAAYLLHNGKLHFFDDIDEAIDVYGRA